MYVQYSRNRLRNSITLWFKTSSIHLSIYCTVCTMHVATLYKNVQFSGIWNLKMCWWAELLITRQQTEKTNFQINEFTVYSKEWTKGTYKGTVPRDFPGFFHESVSPKPLSIPLGQFQIFPKIHGDIRSTRCTTGVIDTSTKWKKSSISKVLIVLFGHLWVVELTYRYMFSFKFTLRCKQSDIVSIICLRYHWHWLQI